MVIAQSWTATISTTVPVAAFTTVLLSFALAHWIARRQEFGKARAAAEIALQAKFLELRSQVDYAEIRLQSTSSYDPSYLKSENVFGFLTATVAHTRALPERKQKKIRTSLVELCGEWRVRMAEDIGLAVQQAAPEGATNADIFNAFIQTNWISQHLRGRSDEAGADRDGLLDQLAHAQLPDQMHPAVISALDRLLATVDARVGLTGRATN
ncbi:hypothetical protein ACFU98_29335 [Streptomyces sp. NPDC057575]|uniref:hypothetical protein n=1 Tax=unclassified Streptomyces TaxID=2593676 RepID=UPI0036AF58C5